MNDNITDDLGRADVRQRDAATIRQLVDCGVSLEAAVAYVATGDVRKLTASTSD